MEISSSKLEISTSKLEISTSANWKFRHPNWKFRHPNWKFRLRQTRNFDIPTGNFEFKLEISTSANWKFRHPNWKFRVQTRNFDFVKLEISTSQLEISSSNSKFRLRQMVNEPICWNNYITKQQLEMSTSSNWKFRVQSGNFEFQTGNFDFQTGNFDFQTGNF